MFFYPDLRDRDGLLSFAYEEAREKELREIQGVVGKSLSKHQRKQRLKDRVRGKQDTTFLDGRDRSDYFRPNQKLFMMYCEEIVTRYRLENLVEKLEVSSISYAASSKDTGPWCIYTQHFDWGGKGSDVVLTVGASLNRALPSERPFYGLKEVGSVTHAFRRFDRSPFPGLEPHFAFSCIRENRCRKTNLHDRRRRWSYISPSCRSICLGRRK